eukprot:GHVR01045949.1.p2 GENE.GHVR01045949.1~~GHVR01045949.1.p2  ORF type:complete len:143 (-),score=11.94 GHVR01045949.1:40-468(-)
MSNVRFSNESFILLDLESFQDIPSISSSPYPRVDVGDIIWTLWQAITCVWCVAGDRTEDVYRLNNKLMVPLPCAEDFFLLKYGSLASYIYHLGVETSIDGACDIYRLQIADCCFPGGLMRVIRQLQSDASMRSWVGVQDSMP